jgi:hypothetical protein
MEAPASSGREPVGSQAEPGGAEAGGPRLEGRGSLGRADQRVAAMDCPRTIQEASLRHRREDFYSPRIVSEQGKRRRPQYTQAWRIGRAHVIAVVKSAARLLRRLGPYAAIELLLPGGSLLALLLWLYRARVANGTLFAPSSGSVRARPFYTLVLCRCQSTENVNASCVRMRIERSKRVE